MHHVDWPGLASPHPRPYAALTLIPTPPLQDDQGDCLGLVPPQPRPSPQPRPYTPLQDDQGDRWPQLPRPRGAVWRRAVHQRSGHMGGGLRAGRAAAAQGEWSASGGWAACWPSCCCAWWVGGFQLLLRGDAHTGSCYGFNALRQRPSSLPSPSPFDVSPPLMAAPLPSYTPPCCCLPLRCGCRAAAT